MTPILTRAVQRAIPSILIAATLLFVAAPALAQINPARLRGKVTNEKGDPVGKINLEFEPTTGARATQTVKVSKKGSFMVAYFPSGIYRVSLEEGSEFFLKSLSFTVKEPSGILMNSGAAEAHPETGVPELQVIAGTHVDLEIVVTDAAAGQKLKQQMASQESKGGIDKTLELFRAGRHDEAIAEADTLLAGNADLGAAHQLKGLALAAKGQSDDAIASLRRALELMPDQPSVKGAIGSALLDKGRDAEDMGKADDAKKHYAEAAAMFEAELETSPGDVTMLTNRAIALDRAGRTDEAIAALEDLLETSPDNVTIYFRLAALHRAAGNDEAAIAVLGRVPTGNVDAAKAIYNVATGLYNDKQYESARVALDKAIEIDPGLAPAFRLRGYVHLATGDSAAGKADHQKSHELDPDHAEAEQDRAIVESIGG